MSPNFSRVWESHISWMKMLELRLKFVPKGRYAIFYHWFRQWLGADQATSHYLNQWWLIYWRINASLGHNELTLQMTHDISSGIIEKQHGLLIIRTTNFQSDWIWNNYLYINSHCCACRWFGTFKYYTVWAHSDAKARACIYTRDWFHGLKHCVLVVMMIWFCLNISENAMFAVALLWHKKQTWEVHHDSCHSIIISWSLCDNWQFWGIMHVASMLCIYQLLGDISLNTVWYLTFFLLLFKAYLCIW